LNPHPSRAQQSGYRFAKEAKLLRPADYRKVYDYGTRRNLDFLLAFALPTERTFSRIGLTVPRAVGGAVQRNLLKRRMREAVRAHLSNLGPGWDIVFNVRQAALRVPFSMLDATVGKFFVSCAVAQRKPVQAGARREPESGRAAR
jgi:ribonuclease P protein component